MLANIGRYKYKYYIFTINLQRDLTTFQFSSKYSGLYKTGRKPGCNIAPEENYLVPKHSNRVATEISSLVHLWPVFWFTTPRLLYIIPAYVHWKIKSYSQGAAIDCPQQCTLFLGPRVRGRLIAADCATFDWLLWI